MGRRNHSPEEQERQAMRSFTVTAFRKYNFGMRLFFFGAPLVIFTSNCKVAVGSLLERFFHPFQLTF